MKRIYLDHNATSPMPPEVRARMAQVLETCPGNPSSPHEEGQKARLVLESAREEIASALGAAPGELIFTSGGTESNNIALRAVPGEPHAAPPARRGRVLASRIEHPSVMESVRRLEAEGVEVGFLPVDGRGLIDPGALESALAERPAALVTVMHANNETGVVQSVGRLGRIARAAGAVFHTDMAQTLGRIPVGEAAAAADRITLAAHKIGGPVGIGALVWRGGDGGFHPLLAGGSQESRRRPGTEPVALAAGFAEAVRLRLESLEETAARIGALRDRLEAGLRALFPAARIHGEGAPRLPNTTNVRIPGVPGRILVLQLDRAGFAVSTGAACSSGAARPSQTLLAMGCPAEEALDSIRISLGPGTGPAEVDAFLTALAEAARRAADSGAVAVPGGPTR